MSFVFAKYGYDFLVLSLIPYYLVSRYHSRNLSSVLLWQDKQQNQVERSQDARVYRGVTAEWSKNPVIDVVISSLLRLPV
jgi:hypothetical protein